MCTGLEAELQGRRDSQCQGILFLRKIAIIVWNKTDNGLSLELVRDFHSPHTADYRKDHKKNSSSLWGRQSLPETCSRYSFTCTDVNWSQGNKSYLT